MSRKTRGGRWCWALLGVLAAGVLLSSGSPALAAGADRYEMDDNPAVARPIAPGETQQRSIFPVGDQDWVKFTLTEAAMVVIDTNGPQGDPDMTLYGPNDPTREIEYCDDAHGLWPMIRRFLQPGTYYARITDLGNDNVIDSYTLSLTIQAGGGPGPGGGGGDRYEPDDTPEMAKVINPGEAQQRAITPRGDQDWVKFTLAAPGMVVLDTNGPQGDPEMTLFGPNNWNNEIAYCDDDHGLWPAIRRFLQPGTYYVRMKYLGDAGEVPSYTLTLALQGGAGPGGGGADRYEPDDTPDQAKTINPGETQQRSILPGTDMDWVRFTLAAPGMVTLDTNGPQGDPDMTLYGPNDPNNQIEYCDDAHGLWPMIRRFLQPGTYYVRIKDLVNNREVPSYTLTLTVEGGGGPPGGGGDRFEPDDTPNMAKPINPGETQQRAITPQGDQDWVRFTVAAPAMVTIDTNGPQGDPEMTLFGPNNPNNELAYCDDAHGLWPMIRRFLQPGTYYVRINALGNTHEVLSYSLTVTLGEGGPAGGGDRFEPDDTPEMAKDINPGEVQQRSIHVVGDADWARFTLAQPSEVIIDTNGPAGDSYLDLYGPNNWNTRIASDDDTHGLWAQIGPLNLQPGTYYIRVSEFGNNGTIPSYTLSLTVRGAGGPPIGPGGGGDQYEPDNTPDQAKTINPGEVQQRSIMPQGDQDWVKFTLTQPSDVDIDTNGPMGDSYLHLYGPNDPNNEIASRDDAHGLWAQIFQRNLPPGTYYVKLRAFGNGAIPSLTLSLRVTPAGGGPIEKGPIIPVLPPGGADRFEPDDTPEMAKTINPGETQQRSISPVGDHDWVKFTLNAPAQVVIDTNGPQGDPEMTLFGPNNWQNEIAYCDDDHGLWPAIRRFLQPGTYYVRMNDLGNNNTVPFYTLTLLVQGGAGPIIEPKGFPKFKEEFVPVVPVFPKGLPVGAPDQFEPDNTPDAAKMIKSGEVQQRSLHAVGERDWVKFVLTEASDVDIDTNGPQGDSYLYLYGPDDPNRLIESNDDTHELWARIQRGGLAPGTYYIMVRGFGNQPIPSYTLSLRVTPRGNVKTTPF